MNIETALKEAMTIDGALGVCLVDWDSGMSLGALGGGKYLDLDVAAAGNTEVIRAKMRTMESLRLDDAIEDILISLGTISLANLKSRRRGRAWRVCGNIVSGPGGGGSRRPSG